MNRLCVAALASLLLTTAGCDSERGEDTAPGTHATESRNERSVYQRRCPGRGLDALPLGANAEAAARAVAAERVGRSSQIDVALRRVPATGSTVAHACGPRIARRSLYLLTYDHRFDHGPNKSASLAQHRFYVSRFVHGYRAWYWEH